MHDIKFIRENGEAFDAAMARRGLGAQSAAILKLDEERRGLQTKIQEWQTLRNEASNQIGILHNPKSSLGLSEEERQKEIAGKTERVRVLKNEMDAWERHERTAAEALSGHLASLPNILAADVPEGADEAANVEIRKGKTAIAKQSGPDHVEIGERLGMMDFETAAKMSGSRFVLLSGGLARLERALAQFMLDTHTQEHGYTECSPPLLVRDEAAFGTGQLPKFQEDLFRSAHLEIIGPDKIRLLLYKVGTNEPMITFATSVSEQEQHRLYNKILNAKEVRQFYNEDGLEKIEIPSNLWLIPTAEVSLTNIVAGEIVAQESLPRRYTAFTPCFRSEAGSAGKDTRGMLRQHQFYKVEMVSIVKPEESAAEHERMTGCAEAILDKLGIPFRTVVLCTGDTGFGATKTYDIEAWLPGQETYREISSCSNCADFQARRMNARYKNADGKNTYVHTLNGSGVAVGRALIAVMENYWDGEGVMVPDALKPYMGGVERIVRI